MSFNSWQYLVFLPVVLLLFSVSDRDNRWKILLLSSYLFYTFSVPWYSLLLITSTSVTWLAALQIEKTTLKFKRKLVLAVALAIEFGILATFKYLLPFIGFNNMTGNNLFYAVALPVGISFYTFKSAGYLTDVYRGTQQTEKNLLKYALFVSYFPQLIAGPIDRASHLMPQLNNIPGLQQKNLVRGLERIIWGFFKKVVIADNIRSFTEHSLSLQEDYSGIQVYITLLLFSIQILADFSGYCDIALGTSMLFGIKLSENFNRPYLKTSISAFWNSWNLTLTHWVRDYIYYPLNKGIFSKWKIYFNTFITFLIIGIWHGPSLNFVYFGLYNGIIVIAEHILNPSSLNYYLRKTNAGKWLLVFKNYHVILIGTVLFCSSESAKTRALYNGLLNGWNNTDILRGFPIFDFALIIALSFSFALISYLRLSKKATTRIALSVLALVMIYLFGVGENTAFYYFQF